MTIPIPILNGPLSPATAGFASSSIALLAIAALLIAAAALLAAADGTQR